MVFSDVFQSDPARVQSLVALEDDLLAFSAFAEAGKRKGAMGCFFFLGFIDFLVFFWCFFKGFSYIFFCLVFFFFWGGFGPFYFFNQVLFSIFGPY